MRMQIDMFFSYFLSICHMFFFILYLFLEVQGGLGVGTGGRGQALLLRILTWILWFERYHLFHFFNVCSGTNLAYDTTLIHLFFDMLGGGGWDF
jgi:hypothetical protein